MNIFKTISILICCLVCASSAVATSNKAPAAEMLSRKPTAVVALAPLWSEDDSSPCVSAAHRFTDILYAELFNYPDVECVDRANIDQAIKELFQLSVSSERGTSLKVGHWVEADILIQGGITFAEKEEDGRVLVLEVIDLSRAELLASTRIPIQQHKQEIHNTNVHQNPASTIVITSPRGPVKYMYSIDNNILLASFNEIISKAIEMRKSSSGKVFIAPLFFSNKSEETERLDFAERDLLDAFAAENKKQAQIHFMSLSSAASATEEHSLALSGLVDAESDEWRGLADYYVWGFYKEQYQSKIPFEKVTVKFTIFTWDGMSAPKSFSFEERVGNLANVYQLIIHAAMNSIGHDKENSAYSDELRKTVADSLFLQARLDIDNAFLDKNHREGAAINDNMKSQHRRILRMLETAHFFYPESDVIARELLIEKYNRVFLSDKSHWARNYKWDQIHINQARDWIKYADCYGFAFDIPYMPIIKGKKIRDERIFPYEGGRIYFENYMRLSGQTWPANNYYSSLSSHEKNVYRENWSRQYIDSLERVFNDKELTDWIPVARLWFGRSLADIDPKQRVRFLDIVSSHIFENDTDNCWSKNLPVIKQAYKSLGVLERMPVMQTKSFSSLRTKTEKQVDIKSTHTKKASSSGAKRRFRFYAPECLPPSLNVNMRSLPLDKFCKPKQCSTMAFLQGQLYFSTGNTTEWSSGYQSKVGCYNPMTGSLQSLTEKLGVKSHIKSIQCSDNRIWFLGPSDGAVTLKPSRHFTFRDGLPTMHIECSTLMNGRIYVGGGKTQAACGYYDAEQDSWLDLKVPLIRKLAGKLLPPAPITVMGSFDDCLLIYGGNIERSDSFGRYDSRAENDTSAYLYLYNCRSGIWSDVGLKLFNDSKLLRWNGWHKQFEPFMKVTSIKSDQTGFWIGSHDGLVHYNPHLDVVRAWMPAHNLLIDESNPLFAKRQEYFLMRSQNNSDYRDAVPITRLAGKITALAGDDEFLYIATRPYDILNTGHSNPPWQKPRVFVLSKKTFRWLGQFEVPGCKTIMAMENSHDKLWVAPFSMGHFNKVLIFEINKSSFLAPPRSLIYDKVPNEEIEGRVAELPEDQRQKYYFLSNAETFVDYEDKELK
ncbi:MAG: hypothetical protein PF692_05095 [Kiritimatiellae bacterium]|nr:hypothetical protein [Kiritimatiellia bacterium]